jgi:hypothetical protein
VIAGSFENGLGHWREFAASSADREALTTTCSSLRIRGASLIIGVPLAFLLGRFDFLAGAFFARWQRFQQRFRLSLV